jgi:hypothetical protein
MEITGIQWQVFGLDVPTLGVLLPWISKYNPLVSDSIHALVAEYNLWATMDMWPLALEYAVCLSVSDSTYCEYLCTQRKINIHNLTRVIIVRSKSFRWS